MVTGDADGIIDAGVGAVVADSAAQELRPSAQGGGRTTCANCGADLAGPHCHECGQSADDLHQPFWALFKDALEGLFSLDGRFLKTVPSLLLQPGRVSATYLAGARARFVQPFRLYLFASILFLLMVSVVTGDWTSIDFDPVGEPPGREEAIAGMDRAIEGMRARGQEPPEELLAAREEMMAATADLDMEVLDDPFIREQRRAERATDIKCEFRRALLPEELGSCPPEGMEDGPSEMFGEDGPPDLPIATRRYIVHQVEVVVDDPSRFLEQVNVWLSRVLIALFPVYAVLLALTHFWKRRFYYYDHLIVSLHFHAFIFLFVSILIALSFVLPTWLLILAFFVWGNYFVYKTHRLVYGCGRVSSALRTLTMDALYLVVLSFVPLIIAVGGFLTA